MKKYRNIKNIILPNKKINIFIVSILFLGIIAGSLFVNIISMNDRSLVIDKIKLFIDNISNSSLSSILVFKNSISINLIYVIIIWILGLSLIGIIFNIFILFIKGFIFGFGIASFIVTYSYKGLALSFLYLLFGELMNIIETSYGREYFINLLSHNTNNIVLLQKNSFFPNFNLKVFAPIANAKI